MQELLGRLTALDPQASESLKIVTYFDALVSGRVSAPTLIKGAAILTGANAGAIQGSRCTRVSPDGDLLSGRQPDEQWPTRPLAGGVVWIERAPTLRANDLMVLERLALSIDLVHPVHDTRRSALAIAVDSGRSHLERRDAARDLLLAPDASVRVAVVPLSSSAPGAAVIPGDAGEAVRVMILTENQPLAPPIGVGIAVAPDALPRSFRSAIFALRLSETRGQVVDAEKLGVLFTAAEALADDAMDLEDVRALRRLGDRDLAVVHELANTPSVRAAASSLGFHHSTLQAKHERVVAALGFDPHTAEGSARYQLARILLDVASRFRP
jgi:hypothetical protein